MDLFAQLQANATAAILERRVLEAQEAGRRQKYGMEPMAKEK